MNTVIAINKKQISFIEKDGWAFTDSLTIAEVLDKVHRNVLQKVGHKKHLFGEANFGPSSYASKQNKKMPMYFLDRDISFCSAALDTTSKTPKFYY